MHDDIIIDCRTVTSREGFWAAYAAAIPADSARHFGRNLDALRDGLSAGGPGCPGDCVVRLQHFAALRRIDGALARGLEKMASDLAGEQMVPRLQIES